MTLSVQDIIRELRTSRHLAAPLIVQFENAVRNHACAVNGHSAIAVDESTATSVRLADCHPLTLASHDTSGVTFNALRCADRAPAQLRIVFPDTDQPGDDSPRTAAEELAHAKSRSDDICWNPLPGTRCVAVHDVEDIGGFRCLSRQPLAGETLPDVVSSAGQLPFEAALDCGQEVAQFLADVHAAGYVHGSLQPKHCLLDDDGQLWLQIDKPFTRAGEAADPTCDQQLIPEVLKLLAGDCGSDPQDPRERTLQAAAEHWSRCQSMTDTLNVLQAIRAGDLSSLPTDPVDLPEDGGNSDTLIEGDCANESVEDNTQSAEETAEPTTNLQPVIVPVETAPATVNVVPAVSAESKPEPAVSESGVSESVGNNRGLLIAAGLAVLGFFVWYFLLR